jgi:hypothetical protein
MKSMIESVKSVRVRSGLKESKSDFRFYNEYIKDEETGDVKDVASGFEFYSKYYEDPSTGRTTKVINFNPNGDVFVRDYSKKGILRVEELKNPSKQEIEELIPEEDIHDGILQQIFQMRERNMKEYKDKTMKLAV